MTRTLRSHWLSCIGLMTALLLSPSSLAQTQPASTESIIDVPVGEVFEIVAVYDNDGAEFSWVLSKERDFLEAKRDKLFRTRLIDAANYTLDAEVRDGNQVIRHRFWLRAAPAEPDPLANNQAGDFVATKPEMDSNGVVTLPTGQFTIRLTPYVTSQRQLTLDLDANRDTDSDGNPQNDVFSTEAFFGTNQTPLHLWFAAPAAQHNLSLSFADSNDVIVLSVQSGQNQGINLVGSPPSPSAKTNVLSLDQLRSETTDPSTELGAVTPTPVSNANVAAPNALAPTADQSGRVQFAIDISDKPYASAPLLLQWDFGDGNQSLLDAPVHTYRESGTYDVTVTIRDLQTGTIVDTWTSQTQVTVPVNNVTNDPVFTTNGNNQGVNTNAPTDNQGTNTQANTNTNSNQGEADSDSGILGLVMKIAIGLILLIILIAIIAGIIALLKRAGGMRGALDTMEKKLTKTESTTETEVVETTTETTVESAEDTDVADVAVDAVPTPEVREAEVVEPAPVGETAATPDWLQQGMDQADATGQTASSPPPPTLQDESVPEQTPPPSGTPDWLQADDVPATEEATTPDWLQADTPATDQPATTDDAATPDWLQTDEATDVSATTSETSADTATPDWLQTEPAQPVDTPVATETPPLDEIATQEPTTDASTSDDATPDWLQTDTPVTDQPATPEATEAPVTEEPTPDWLQINEEQSTDTETTEVAPNNPPAETSADTPDWLQASTPPVDATANQPTPPPPPAEPVLASTETAPADTTEPTWLESKTDDDVLPPSDDTQIPTEPAEPVTETAGTEFAAPETEAISPDGPTPIVQDVEGPAWPEETDAASDDTDLFAESDTAGGTGQDDGTGDDGTGDDSTGDDDDAAAATASGLTDEQWQALSPDERERERKRQKRRRYRENKKRRKEAEKLLENAAPANPTEDQTITPADGSDDVQFLISADSLNGIEPDQEEDRP